MARLSLSSKLGLEFDIYVMELCEIISPKSCKDLECLSEDLHERVEMAIQDYIYDSDSLDIDDYNASY